jgi:hypothetical protein
VPAQPAWFHRLEEILEELRALEISHLDRLAVQKLFGVRERRARQILAGLPASRSATPSPSSARHSLRGWRIRPRETAFNGR